MARPSKEYSVRQNNGSLQAYIKGVYVGSISLKELCENIKAKKYSKEVSAQ